MECVDCGTVWDLVDERCSICASNLLKKKEGIEQEVVETVLQEMGYVYNDLTKKWEEGKVEEVDMEGGTP